MNRIIALLFIAQFICLSQSAQTKRASDACPGTNNKNNTSNDYAYLSKRSAAKDNSDFSKPKYQSIYAKNTGVNTAVKRGKAIAREESAISETAARPEKQTTPTIKEEKNKTSKAVRLPENEEEFVEPKKVEETKPIDVVSTEKAVSPEPKPIVTKEEGKTASSKKPEKATSKNGATKSTDLTTTKTTKQKQQKKNTTKKLRIGKKCATDCPEF